MYCTNCGSKIDENAYVCLNCGVLINNNKSNIKKKNKKNVVGVFSIIFGIIAFSLSIHNFLGDISDVGMYTSLYERILYGLGYTFFSIVPALLTLMFSLNKKNSPINNIGLSLALLSFFFIITEIMVICIY